MDYTHRIVRLMRIDIPRLRKRLGGISQAELGRRLGGITQATISRWEAGISTPDGPAQIVLQQLAASVDAQERAA